MHLRPLLVLLAVQLLIGVALVVWASQGFPLPGGGDEPAPVPERQDGARGAPAPGGEADGPVDQGAAAAQGLPPRPRTDRFDARRAYALVRRQTQVIGPRPAGSAASRRLARELRGLLPNGRLERVAGHPGLRNVVGRLPGRGPAILVAAHYDTEARPVGHLGANDGAAGTAVVVELAQALRRQGARAGDREVRFVLFDGEEEPAGCEPFEACGLRGSRAYAARHADRIGHMVLLDYVGERTGLRFPREANSDPRLWARLRAAARRVGTISIFPDRTGVAIVDDHVPFLRRGVPAIDLIDFDYPHRDSLQDTLDKVGRRSLDAVGETVMSLLLRLR